MVKNKSHDYEPNHTVNDLKKKIEYLEEELVRKDGIISKLRKENELLFKTALKSSQDKVDNKKNRLQA